MSDRYCRVTVVGSRRRVDLALPARASVGEYAASLATYCGEDEDEALPAAWTVAPAGGAPLPPEASLHSAGILDGDVLYLLDAAAGEYHEPVVREVDEIVAEATGDGWLRWNPRSAALTGLTGGALLVVVAVSAAAGAHAAAPLAVLLAAAAGTVATLLGRVLDRLDGPPAEPLVVLVGALPVPCFAAAGWAGAAVAGAGPDRAPAAAVGALIGAFAMLLAVPGLTALAVLVVGGCTAAAAVTGALLHLTPERGAATLALFASGFLALAPGNAGRLTAAAYRSQRTEHDGAGESAFITSSLRRGRLVLTGWSVTAALVLGWCFVVLTRSPDGFAWAFTGCLVLALALRAGKAALLPEAAGHLGAAGAGLAALALHAGGRLGGSTAGGPALLALFGLAVATAAVWALSRPPRVSTPDRRRERRTQRSRQLMRAAATAAMVALGPLLIGVYGVYPALFALGHRL